MDLESKGDKIEEESEMEPDRLTTTTMMMMDSSPPNQEFSTVIETDVPSGGQFQENLAVQESTENQQKICRICHDDKKFDDRMMEGSDEVIDEDDSEFLVAPCKCTGSMTWTHRSCLQQWLTISKLRKCEICKYPYNVILEPPHWIEYVKDSLSVWTVIRHSAALLCICMCPFLIYFTMYNAEKMKDTALSNGNPTSFIIWLTLSSVLTICSFAAGMYSLWELRKCHQRKWKIWRDTNPRTRVFLILKNSPLNQNDDEPVHNGDCS